MISDPKPVPAIPIPEVEPTNSRLWVGIAVGTVIQTISYGSLLLGAVASATDSDVAAGPPFTIGFALVPLVCAAVAFISSHQRAAMATVKGMGIWLVVALPLSLANPIVGLSAGFAASGAFTLRTTVMKPGRNRSLGVLFVVAYLAVLVFILPQAAILAGALSPLLVIRTADIYSERSEAGLAESQAA